MVKDFERILAEFKARRFKPVYLLHGDEPFYIDQLVEYAEDYILDEAERDFNQTVLYGKDAEAQQLLEVCRRLPMMAQYQLVILKEAQEFRGLDKLEKYFESPSPQTIFIIAYKYKKADARKKYVKAIQKTGQVFLTKKLYDNQIPQWIEDHLATKGFYASPKAIALLADYLGNDLNKIDNEISKLSLNLEQGARITTDIIEENIGLSKDFNSFELNTAVARRDIEKVHTIVNYFGKNSKNHPITLTIITLYGFLSNVLKYHFLPDKSDRAAASKLGMNPFFLNDIKIAARNYSPKQLVRAISQLKVFDLKSKGVNNVGTTEGDLLRELMLKIMYK